MDDFNQVSGNESDGEKPTHSLKGFLNVIKEELDGFIKQNENLLAAEKIADHPDEKTILITTAVLFVERNFRDILKEKIRDIKFLSNDDIRGMFPELQDEDLGWYDLIEDEYELPPYQFPDHTLYYQYIEDDLWEELDERCINIDNILDCLQLHDIKVNKEVMEMFDKCAASAINNLQDQIGATYSATFPDSDNEFYFSVEEALEEVTEKLAQKHNDLLGHAKQFKEELSKNNDMGFLAGNFAIYTTYNGTILEFLKRVEFIDDKDLPQYFPDYTPPEYDEDGKNLSIFDQISMTRILNTLAQEQKAPSNPIATPYICAMLLADVEFIQNNKAEIKKGLEFVKDYFGEVREEDFIAGFKDGFKEIQNKYALISYADEPDAEVEAEAEAEQHETIESADFIHTIDEKRPLREAGGVEIDLSGFDESELSLREILQLHIVKILNDVQNEVISGEYDIKDLSEMCGIVAALNHYPIVLRDYLKEVTKDDPNASLDDYNFESDQAYEQCIAETIDDMFDLLCDESSVERVKEAACEIASLPEGLDAGALKHAYFTNGFSIGVAFIEEKAQDKLDVHTDYDYKINKFKDDTDIEPPSPN